MPASSKQQQPPELIHGVKPYKARKGEKFMNDKQRTHFRAILEGWRDELMDEVSRTVHAMQDETTCHWSYAAATGNASC